VIARDPAHRPRIVMLGTDSAYTASALRTLSAAGCSPFALVRPRTVPGVPGVREVRPTMGGAASLPVYEVGRLDHPDGEGLRARLAPDLVVVACHPRRVPPSWLFSPALGCWNIHPSLLPAYRGPAPVFWQLRAGEARTGVTVQRMDEDFDTGPVLAQRAVGFPEGARSDELDALLAENGATLVGELVARGDVRETPQDEGQATGQGFPQEADLEVPVTWSARRAFSFLRGAEPWGPFRVRAGSRVLVVAEALSWDPAPCAVPLKVAGREAVIAFAPGTVRVWF